MASVDELRSVLREEGALVVEHPDLGCFTRIGNVTRHTPFTREEVCALLDMGALPYVHFCNRQTQRFVSLTQVIRLIDEETTFRTMLE